jgi:outer membrane receptor protein involved in Fe transport
MVNAAHHASRPLDRATRVRFECRAKLVVRLVLALILVLVLTSFADAQTGSVAGTVVDESNAVVRGAQVVLTGPSARHTQLTGATGEYRFEDVLPGAYRLSVFVLGFAEAVRDNVVVSSDEVALQPIQLAIAGVNETVVVSASRSASALIDAPATMTVLPSSVLEASPAENFADLLRSVPGMNAIQTSARDVNLTSRQASTLLATSQLALVDGRSVYLDFFGMILWDFVPTNPSDIRQIEVVRGPASAVWGANALTGVVNVVTKSPRETRGTTNVTLSAGLFDRNAGSLKGSGNGVLYGANASTSQVVNDTWSYRVSAGYFNSDPFARPTGQIPVIIDPRDPSETATVGGAFYPADAPGQFGTAFQNQGTSQPKFDARVDQELQRGRISYSGGVAGTDGTIHTGIGPFDIQPGSVMSYGRVLYTRDVLRLSAFANVVSAQAPNLLVPDPRTGGPLQLDFKTQTYDIEVGHSASIGGRHALNYGGNYRRNNFDITLAPTAKNRNEIGAFVQDEIFLDRFRFSIGARLDKFGNIETPVFSPRLTAMYQPTADQSLRVSFNRAFRSPSTINNYIDIALASPIDLSALAPLLPPPLDPLVADPFPLVVRVVGSEIPIENVVREPLTRESLTAYEVAYTGTFQRTTVGAAFYVNDMNDSITFTPLPTDLDPYTPANPPPGWQLPPQILGIMAQLGIFLPRTGFSYFNLGPTRQKGIELSIDHRVSQSLSTFVNYSWQDDPVILDDPDPFPFVELSLPPKHRFNLGGAYNGRRFLGALNLNYTSESFWSDVLTPDYDGFTDAFTMVNGSFGVRWHGGRVTTLIKSTNLLNETIQQHIFGDLMRRSVTAEVRFDF